MSAATVLLLAAAPAGAAPQVRTGEFETYCAPVDPGLAELSGLTVVDDVLYGIGDSGTDHRVAVLDGECAVTRWLEVPVDPYDVEDLASHDGRLWLSDTGDNLVRRDTVALTGIDPGTGAGELHRLVYPDGPHDAETLLIESSGRPVVVTKELSGVSGVYVPAGDESVDELPSPGPVSLRKVGETAFERTQTVGGPPFVTGSILATGGAVSADGTVAAIRTYNDVHLFAVRDGNVAEALSGEPVVVALPAQPQGEAMTFDRVGNLLVGSEAANGPFPPIEILRDATSLVQPPSPPATVQAESSASGRWPIGALVGAGALALVSLVYAAGSARRRS